jgi:hypothetical protein
MQPPQYAVGPGLEKGLYTMQSAMPGTPAKKPLTA